MQRAGLCDGSPSDHIATQHISNYPALCTIDNALPSAPRLHGPETGQKRTPGRGVPDGQHAFRSSAEAREEGVHLSGERPGGDDEAGQGTGHVGDHARGSTCRDHGPHPGQPSPADTTRHLPDAHLVSEVSAGGDASKDLLQVQDGAAGAPERQYEAHVDMQLAGAVEPHTEPGRVSQVCDGQFQGVQIRFVHSRGGGTDDHESRLRDCAVREESPGLLFLHVRAGGRRWRGDGSPGQEPARATHAAGRSRTASLCCAAECRGHGAEEISAEPELARQAGVRLCHGGSQRPAAAGGSAGPATCRLQLGGGEQQQQSLAEARGRRRTGCRGACASDDVVASALEPASTVASGPVKRGSRAIEAAPLEADEVKRATTGRPRIQCRNAECLSKRASMASELADARARVAQLEQQSASSRLLSTPEVAALHNEIATLKEAAVVMNKCRVTALRTLAVVRGKFDGITAERDKFKDMYQLASDTLSANTKAQKAIADAAVRSERKASIDGRKEIAVLEASLANALEKLRAERDNSAEQDCLARDMTENLNKVQVALKEMEKKEAAGVERLNLAEYELMLTERRELRAKDALQRANDERWSAPLPRSSDQWESLSAEAERKARSREVAYIKGFLESRTFRPNDLCTALHLSGWLDELWGEREMNKIYFEELRCVMATLESEHFGERFGLHLHYEAHLTLAKVVEVTQAACKSYDPVLDFHRPKKLLVDPHCPSNFITVPRIAPSRSRLEPLIRSASEQLGLLVAENGKISFQSLQRVLGELLSEDPGRQGHMPPLSHFVEADAAVPVVISWDATGFGKLKITTIVLNNPFSSQSAQNLRIFGLGMVDDNKDGTKRLLQEDNREYLNSLLRLRGREITSFLLSARRVDVRVSPIVVCDLACFRHCEHLAGSGFCGCPREALRTVLTAPSTEAELRSFLDSSCVSLDIEQRFTLGHNCIPGEDAPRPCVAPGCKFMHGGLAGAAATEAYENFKAEEAKLLQDVTEPGKRR
eukprot:6212749-Pleurochrysis_carterae.AAC.1